MNRRIKIRSIPNDPLPVRLYVQALLQLARERLEQDPELAKRLADGIPPDPKEADDA